MPAVLFLCTCFEKSVDAVVLLELLYVLLVV